MLSSSCKGNPHAQPSSTYGTTWSVPNVHTQGESTKQAGQTLLESTVLSPTLIERTNTRCMALMLARKGLHKNGTLHNIPVGPTSNCGGKSVRVLGVKKCISHDKRIDSGCFFICLISECVVLGQINTYDIRHSAREAFGRFEVR